MEDLAPISGAPLKNLNMTRTKVIDLSNLYGSPLVVFTAWETGIKDLSPLRGAPLEVVTLGGCSELRDLNVLAECQTLRELTLPPNAEHVEAFRHHLTLKYLSYKFNSHTGRPGQTVEEFWREYDAKQAAGKK